MSSREEFEEAMLEMEHPHFGFLCKEYLAKEGEEYLDVYMQGLWIGWKASRAALVVELPPRVEMGLLYFDESKARGQLINNTIYKCAEAIEAAGITVKVK